MSDTSASSATMFPQAPPPSNACTTVDVYSPPSNLYSGASNVSPQASTSGLFLDSLRYADFADKVRQIYFQEYSAGEDVGFLKELNSYIEQILTIKKTFPRNRKRLLFAAIVRLNLAAITATIMLEREVDGLNSEDPIIQTLTKIIEHTSGPLSLVRHHAWYIRNLFLASKLPVPTTSQQIKDLSLSIAKILFVVGIIVIPPAVTGPVAAAAIVTSIIIAIKEGPKVIAEMQDCWRKIKVVTHFTLQYNAHIHHSIICLTSGSSVLYTKYYKEINDYLNEAVGYCVSNRENYHGVNIVIIKDIIDILTGRLLIEDNDLYVIFPVMSVLEKIYTCCMEHFKRWTFNIHDENYNEIGDYSLYSMYRLRALSRSQQVRGFADFILTSTMKPDSEKDKKIKGMLGFAPRIQVFYTDVAANVITPRHVLCHDSSNPLLVD